MFYEEIYQPKVSYCNRDERLPMKLAYEFWHPKRNRIN